MSGTGDVVECSLLEGPLDLGGHTIPQVIEKHQESLALRVRPVARGLDLQAPGRYHQRRRPGLSNARIELCLTSTELIDARCEAALGLVATLLGDGGRGERDLGDHCVRKGRCG